MPFELGKKYKRNDGNFVTYLGMYKMPTGKDGHVFTAAVSGDEGSGSDSSFRITNQKSYWYLDNGTYHGQDARFYRSLVIPFVTEDVTPEVRKDIWSL